MKLWMWICLGVLVVTGVAGGGFVLWQKSQKSNVDSAVSSTSSAPTEFIQADFVDLSKIFMISKFRSGSGHDFSGNGETCRSMKHYFAPNWSQEGQKLRDANNNIPPEPDGKTDIDIFSPVDGTITGVQSEQMPIGEQIYIQPELAKDYTIRLFHIYKSTGIKKGSKVTAGQKIGVIGQYSSTDIAVQKGRNNFISYFDVMPDSIFATYIDRGAKSKNEMVISKAERDANPLQCNGEQFAKNYDSDPSFGNQVFLSGYTGGTGSQSSTSNQPSTTPATVGTPTESETSGSTGGSSGSGGGTGGGSGSGAGTGGGSGSGSGGGGGRR